MGVLVALRIIYSGIQIFQSPRETKIGSKIGVKLQCLTEEGNNFWFELLRGLKKRGFQKSGFHCTYWSIGMGVKVLPRQFCLLAPTNFASTSHPDTHICDKIGYSGERQYVSTSIVSCPRI